MSDNPAVVMWMCVHQYEDNSREEITVCPEIVVNIRDSGDTVSVHSNAQCQQLIKALEFAALQQWPEETDT